MAERRCEMVTRQRSSIYDALQERVTAGEFAAAADMAPEQATAWLWLQQEAGYIDRDGQGRYATWCAWPRSGA
jgi:hypothetical protein